ncbi:Metallo-dependent phosphatase-like protein [Irpex rosettiformis]|uniref:Metallo-dependent phosphatase-like protein n=1 Tax=Irpex rosettiformis TaxID=378272 RepID=A0ACB8U2T3_9APHY|nr:Metallo-dependent phosphatase-like protein [Irpex rosettiformis]
MADNLQEPPEFQVPQPEGSGFPEDTFRIMVATDNHIGYLERDPVRGQDSINTFREILQLAVKYDVDLVLLAGDLFHENRPSRDTIYQVMALLREYCLNDRPVQIELLSDPDEGKAAGYSFPAINYEDPNLNVGMPVFSIHGNHDDPQGAGPEGALCALDMLSVSGLINYMGKIDLPHTMNTDGPAQEGIAIKPVLLRKGSSRLALYGVGNVKDARMHFELRSNRVKMYMPKDKKDWFNILLLHQNRVPHGPQQSVPEGMFDDSIDFVIWGHEHDCRVDPEEVAGKQYRICQPGSSVATSLADGEAIEKKVALMEVHGKEYRLTPIPLRTVRPFVMGEVILSNAAEDEGFDLNDRMAISKYLRAKVNELIDEANQQWDERNERAKQDGETELPRMLPLVRLKVDTTGVTETSNPVRFGQEFQGRIANPRDVLIFHRAKRAARSDKVIVEKPELSIDDPDLSNSEKLSKVRVHTLVHEYLSAQELQLLGELGMSDAIELFVDKDDLHAISRHVSSSLRKLMGNVQTNGKDIDIEEDDLEELFCN